MEVVKLEPTQDDWLELLRQMPQVQPIIENIVMKRMLIQSGILESGSTESL